MLKSIKSLIKSITLVSVVLAGCFIYPEVHNSYLRYEVGESVVQVLAIAHNGGGTGFAVQGKSGKKYIMTNKHVCQVQANGIIRIKAAGKDPVFRKVIYMDTRHDLCLIEGLDDLAAITIGSEPEIGNIHYVVGHPGLRSLSVQSGEYTGPATVTLREDVLTRDQCHGKIVELPPLYQMFLGAEFLCLIDYRSYGMTSVIYPGNSGSPVVNKFGNLIGVAFAGSTDEEHDTYSVPLTHVKRILERY